MSDPTTRAVVYLPRADYIALRKLLLGQGISFSAFVREAVKRTLANPP